MFQLNSISKAIYLPLNISQVKYIIEFKSNLIELDYKLYKAINRIY